MESKRFDVVVVGSCMTDLVSYVARLPKPGETIHSTKFETGFGGKGANQLITAARLKARTAMVCKLGEDTFGHTTVENFKAHDVNTEFVKMTSDAPSGVALITVDEQGENSIVLASGANNQMTDDDVIAALPIIQQSAVVVCQLEVPVSVSRLAMLKAKEAGVRTIFNPAPAVKIVEDTIFAVADVLCVNESEAETFCGKAVTDVDSAKAAVMDLLSRGGAGAVIVTLGGAGVVFKSRRGPGPVHIPAPKVQVVDTTGAGDSFVGSLAYFMACHPSLELNEIIRRAVAIASISVQKAGTQKSFPQKSELPSSLFE